MSFSFKRFFQGLRIVPKSGSTASAQGDLEVDSATSKMNFHNGSSASPVVTEAHSATLTNKVLSGNTATNLISGSGTLTLNTSGTITVPNATDTLVGKATTDTLTNKTLSGNTATNLVSGAGTLTLNTSGTVTVPNATDTLVGKATTDTLTNKTLTGNTAANLVSGSGQLTLNTSGTMTVPNGTDTVAALALAQTLSNKTFSDSIIQAQIATPATPSAGYNKIYPKSDGNYYTLDPNGAERKIGSAGINYILNPDAEGSTTGWANYADAADTSPVDGTGGSPTTAIARSTSSPLRGTGSFTWAKGAANRQGEGTSYDFTIDSADQGQVLGISFDYTISSGTFADNDMGVWIYDVTNSVLIQPAPYTILNTSVAQRWQGTFQTATNSTSYRLIFHTASTSASAYTLKFDNVQVGPQAKSYGPFISDWLAYTPTGTWSANTTYNTSYWRRVGDSMEVNAKVSLTGAPTGNFSLNIPSGYTIDTSKIAYSTRQTFGTAIGDRGSTSYTGDVFQNDSTSVAVVTTGGTSRWNATTPATWANADIISVTFTVPIVGWSSGQLLSSDADTRVVAARAKISSSQTGINPNGSYVKINLNSVTFDTHAAFDYATNYRYVAPVSGYYRASAFISLTATNILNSQYSCVLYKNGSAYAFIETKVQGAGTATGLGGSAILQLNAGDYVELYLYGAGNNSASTLTAGGETALNIERISGPSQIAASESVSLKYFDTSAQTINSSNNTKVFATKEFDSHGAWNTGTGIFTAPIAGKYRFSVHMSSSSSLAGSDQWDLRAYKNGSTVVAADVKAGTGASDAWNSVQIDGTTSLLAGETLQFNAYTVSASLSLTATSGYNFVSIERVGN